MPVKINGSSSGSVTLAAPASGSDVSLTLPTTAIATESFATSAASSAVAPMGLVAVAPTSIANSGGSASLSDYTVSFSGVSSVSLNGVFSGDYDNYRVLVSGLTGSGTITWRMRTSGTDDSTANHVQRNTSISDSTFAASRTNGGTSFSGHVGLSTTPSAGYIDLANPFEVVPTRISSGFFTAYSASSCGASWGMGAHVASTSFDGITILSTSLTGTVSVYGYKK